MACAESDVEKSTLSSRTSLTSRRKLRAAPADKLFLALLHSHFIILLDCCMDTILTTGLRTDESVAYIESQIGIASIENTNVYRALLDAFRTNVFLLESLDDENDLLCYLLTNIVKKKARQPLARPRREKAT